MSIRLAEKFAADWLNPAKAAVNCAAARAILSELSTFAIMNVPWIMFYSAGDDEPHTLRNATSIVSEPSSMIEDANDAFELDWGYMAPLVIPVRSMIVFHPAAA